jgi:bifunctional N-acetylglutamate synthase/kinase
MDLEALQALLEEAFGKRLPPDYFEDRGKRLLRVYATQSMRGAAILTLENGESIPDWCC